MRNKIEEAAACLHISDSKDIQTDIYTVITKEIAGDALQRFQLEESRRTSAVSPASMHHIIKTYRKSHKETVSRSVMCVVASPLIER